MKIILFLISSLLLFVITVPVSVVAAENQVFVPEIMLSGSEYFGTITSDYEGLVILSSSDPNIAKVATSLYFDGVKKQNIFEITPLNNGDVTISAKFGDDKIDELRS